MPRRRWRPGAACPNWKGLYGSQVQLADGKTVAADDNYIRESIAVAAGEDSCTVHERHHAPFRLTDEQIEAIIDYMNR